MVEKKTNKDKKEIEEEKKEEKKKISKKEVAKKDVAVARGVGLNVSLKQCIYICKVILRKSPEAAIVRLQDVVDEKQAIPMSGLEVGHKKGNLAGGRFPKNACRVVMNVVKQAAANAVVARIENPVIVIAKADKASTPFRKGGRKAKRCHLYLEVRDKTKLMEVKK